MQSQIGHESLHERRPAIEDSRESKNSRLRYHFGVAARMTWCAPSRFASSALDSLEVNALTSQSHAFANLSPYAIAADPYDSGRVRGAHVERFARLRLSLARIRRNC